MLVWGRLLRLSLAPSAAADMAAGIAWGALGWPGAFTPALLILASLLVYHGAMALNDWADREEDARIRPDRPLPSGAVAPGAALGVGLAAVVGGAALGFSGGAAVGGILAAVAVCAVLYDLRGRGPVLGPAMLALCRAGNLGAGVTFGLLASGADLGESGTRFLLPAAYGLYVGVVSVLGRLEDAEDGRPLGRRPTRLLVAAALALTGPFAILTALAPAGERAGALLAFGLSGWSALGLLRIALGTKEWSRPLVMRSMGAALRRLLVFSASCALAAGQPEPWVVAALVLLGYPLSYGLRRVFPPS